MTMLGHACLFALSRLAGGRRCDYYCCIILSLLETIALSGNAFGNQRKEMTKICALAFISATFPLLFFFLFPLIFPFALKTFRWSNNDLSPFHKNPPSGMLGFLFLSRYIHYRQHYHSWQPLSYPLLHKASDIRISVTYFS